MDTFFSALYTGIFRHETCDIHTDNYLTLSFSHFFHRTIAWFSHQAESSRSIVCKAALPSSLALVMVLGGCGGGGGGSPAPAAALPSLSIANASVIEGSTGGVTNLVFTVTLSAASTGAVTVDYATSDGTALSASDYTATAATLTIAAGATTGTITVLVGADTITEPNETLTLTLSNPTGATIATAAATGTITNDDWIYNSTAGIAMINAGFVYVPGGWDVNGDGVVESGFWLSKYQASATATPAVINPNLIDYLAGTSSQGLCRWYAGV